MTPRIAVLIPCFNEEASVAEVVTVAKKALPHAVVYVYDNASTDKTAEKAAKAGAVVRFVPERGKGAVIRRMFSDIDADVYVMTDGDSTYDIKRAPDLIDLLMSRQLDMVTGARIEQGENAYRAGHRFGNAMLTGLVRLLFGIKQKDMLSGFRVFSKRFVKTFPALSDGFQIETELNVFTAVNRLPFAEVDTDYFSRKEGSPSKLSTYKDGFKILMMIVALMKNERPFLFWGGLSAVFALAALSLFFIPMRWVFYLFVLFVLLSGACFFTGIVTQSSADRKKQAQRLAYLSYSLFDPKAR